jgi:NADH-quinone oxidoreductase subunit H
MNSFPIDSTISLGLRGSLGFSILSVIFFLLGIILAVAVVTLLERRLMASHQRRRGPNKAGVAGLLQPFADAFKLMHQYTVLPKKSKNLLFLLAPIYSFFMSLLLWMFLPLNFFHMGLPYFSSFSLLAFISLSSISLYAFVFLKASNNRYSLMGSIRAIAQMISYELSLSLIYLTIFVLHETTSLTVVLVEQYWVSNLWILWPLYILYVITIIAELNRLPFDLAEEESVLVAGFATEYSGLMFALFFLAEYGMMFIYSTLGVILFLGGIVMSVPASFEVIVFCFFINFHMMFLIWCRATFPRYRYDQLVKIGWKVLLPLCGVFCLFYVFLHVVLKYLIFTGLL